MNYAKIESPTYARAHSAAEFSSSVVGSGAVLQWWDGEKWMQKLHDGTVKPAGVDLTSVTAGAADVRAGKLIVDSNGNTVSGSIPDTTPSSSGGVITIPAGYLPEQLVISAGGTAGVFRCETVSSGGSTWTGYKAVLSGGKYSLASSATSGLSFGPVTPQVGQLYMDGALVRIASLYGLLPTNGQVFYAPLTSAGSAATGQTLTFPESAEFVTVDGIQCVHLTNGQITAADTGLPSGNHAVTIATMIRFADFPGDWSGIVGYGAGGDYGNSFSLFINPDNEILAGGYAINVGEYQGSISSDTWYHAVALYDGTNVRLYINGQQTAYSPETLGIELSSLGIGANAECSMYLASVRIYDRALSEQEIADLAAEFSPA